MSASVRLMIQRHSARRVTSRVRQCHQLIKISEIKSEAYTRSFAISARRILLAMLDLLHAAPADVERRQFETANPSSTSSSTYGSKNREEDQEDQEESSAVHGSGELRGRL